MQTSIAATSTGRKVSAQVLADVKLQWQWSAIRQEVERYIDESREEPNAYLYEKASFEPLIVAVDEMFKSAVDISAARLAGPCRFELSAAVVMTGARLESIEMEHDLLTLQVRLNPHLVIMLTIGVSPMRSLMRARGQIADGVARANERIKQEYQVVLDTPTKQKKEKREARRLGLARELLAKAPEAKGADAALITAKAALDALQKLPAYISTESLAEMLVVLKLCNPSNIKTSRNLVKDLVDKGYVSFWKKGSPGENKINTSKVELTQAGYTRLERLLKR